MQARSACHARRQGARPRTSPSARRTARSWRSPTRTRSGRRTPCACSCAASPTRTSRYACGQLRLRGADGTNREGVYWRYELWLREQESALGSITGGNGAIYAVRRADYVEVDPRFGHDLSLPYLMVQRGRRAVYDSEAHAVREAVARPRGRVPPQGADVRALLAASCFAAACSAASVAAVPRRARLAPGCCGTASGVAAPAAARRERSARSARAGSTGPRSPASSLGSGSRRRAACGLPVPGAALAYYYLARHLATVVALVRYLRRGRARGLGEGGGDAMKRALDVAAPRSLLALAACRSRLRRSRSRSSDGGPVLYRQRRVGREGRGVRAPEAPDDGRRRRAARRRATP